ncbi:hypothetical protein M9H77_09883 [Catharanthus roseus]|uniref:Uncharacterized protein n=1 Tax=Catharanthus roseus TaxID=4058 RepID=A0ACC0C2B7_CATRO|nr:hypothetical protein M9H77_09883 [Catharanthus roseus]
MDDHHHHLQQQEEEEELRFVCKWCNKKFSCGKSLGGHIRSHVIANSAESEEKYEPNMKKVSSFNSEKSFKGGGGGDFGGHSGYGLRENPKKSFKAADSNFPLPQEKVCKQCGKGFQSMKALCGHMACHSEKDRGLKDDHSWTSENQKVVMDDDSQSDTESEERKLRSSRSKSKRYKRIIIKSSSFSLANGSSSVSEIDEQEQEEVAMCLMMLSRDSSNWGGVNSVVESSDNNSVVLETKSSSIEMRGGRKEGLNTTAYNQVERTPLTRKLESRKIQQPTSHLDAEIIEQENSDSGYFLGEEMKVESDGSVGGFQRNGALYESKRAKVSVGTGYEETLAEIKKGFSKFKAQKTAEFRKEKYGENGNDDSRYEVRKKIKDSSDNLEMLNESCRKQRHGSLDVELSKSAQKRNKYECLTCKKIFSSYQALGGHRPCHKRNNAYFDSRYEMGENSLEADAALEDSGRKHGESYGNRKASAKDLSSRVDKKIKPKKNKGHECPFCHRIFKNGQALGGHKRSHFIGGAAEEINHRTSIFKADYPELLDLNLPAPLEDEG